MPPPSNPGWKYGYVPSAGEWNNTFAGKADYPVPANQGGTGGQTPFDGNYNLQQRTQVIVPTIAASPLTIYAVRTDLTATTFTLPLASSCQPGDWIEILDCGNNAAVNNITINAAGSDEIYLFATSSATQDIIVDDGGAVIVCIGSAWRMWSLSSLAPGAVTLDGTEAWNVYKNGVIESITPTTLATFIGDIPTYVQWATWFSTPPTASELLALWTPALSFTFPANFAGSVGSSPQVNPAASYVLDINHIVSGTSTLIGNITISTAGAVSFTTIGGISYSIIAGEQLALTGPSSADLLISAFSATFRGDLS